MPGRMQEPKRLQYGAQQYGGMQNMQPQYGGQPMRPAPAVMPPNWQQPQQPRPAPAVMPPDWQQPGMQPPRPILPVMPPSWQQPGAQPPRPALAVMPRDWQQQPALMQMMMQRK
jgi:hypothetical protein